MPDSSGAIADVVLGFDTQQEYDRGRDENPCFGSTIGRVANRIANATYQLEREDKVQLDVNCGDKHHLHGGLIGFHRRKWNAKLIENGVIFSYLSPDGDDKYPGEIYVEAVYKLVLKDDKVQL